LEKMLDDKTLHDTFYKHGLIIGSSHATATGAQSTLGAVTSMVSSSPTTTPVPTRTPPATPAPVAAATPTIDPKADHPSYLSGRTVALALLGSLDPSKTVPGFNDLKTAVEKMGASNVRDALLASLTEAQNDIDKLRTSVATWFDDSMERLSGAYKRKLKWISAIIGLVVALAFNADSFKVGTTLWSDQALRASIVAVATKVATDSLPATGQDVDETKLKTQISNTETSLRGLPIGWRCRPEASGLDCIKQNVCDITFLQLLGWLLTAAALSLGAPFWFDMLNKFINIRGAGTKPERADKKG
jgi:hypothetical protein